MALTYESGEEIHPGDRVTYGGHAGTIELVVDGAGNPETDWYFENCGAGVMVVEPRVFERVYILAPHDDEDLKFVGVSIATSSPVAALPRSATQFRVTGDRFVAVFASRTGLFSSSSRYVSVALT